MEFKGTKGEWKAKNLFNNWIIVHEESDSVVNIRDNESNAKLIASAPNLLEALQRCNKVLSTYNSSKAVDAYLIAQKAIEKALK